MIRNVGHRHSASSPARSRWLPAIVVGLATLMIACALSADVAPADERKGEDERPAVRAEEREREQKREGEGEGRREGERRREGEGERRREGDRERRPDRRVDGEGEGRRRLPRDLARMADELKVTDAQRKAMGDKVAAKETAVRAWRRKNEARLKAAYDALRKANEALRALRAEEHKVAGAAEVDILAVLTPKQLATWELNKIVRMYHRPKAENPTVLSPEQLRQVKALCEEAAADLVAAAAKPAAEAKTAKQKILHEFHKTLYEDVLDDDQRRRGRRPRDPRWREGEPRREGERRREGEPRREGERRREGEPRREGERRREGEGRREGEREPRRETEREKE